MHTSTVSSAGYSAADVPLPVNLAAIDATQLLHVLGQARPPLLIDCAQLPCQRELGICYLVSQLLVLRQGGASVWLRNASPVLRRCLHKLQVANLFFTTE